LSNYYALLLVIILIISNLYLLIISKKVKKIIKSSLISFLIVYSASAMMIINPSYLLYGILIFSFSISLYLGFLYHYYLYRNRFSQKQEMELSIEIISLFLLSSIGLFLYFLISNWIPFIASLIVMGAWSILRVNYQNSIQDNYLKNAKLTFLLIFNTFLLMWFLGGVLNFITGSISTDVNGFISSLALGYLPPNFLYGIGAIFDIISIIATITATPYFFMIVGVWLGVLSVYKLLEEKKIENKIRVTLMIAAYWIYSLYIPSFSPISNKVEYIPYMWYSGFGTYAPVSPSVLLTGIIGTYIVTAILSALFGSRQICSVTCTAPYMLQGTFFNSLRIYNRTSKLGRKTLSSRLQWWFKVNASVLWGSLLIFAILSYLDQIKVINFTIAGNDPTMFLTSLYFNFIWWVQFFAIPFFGNYACATQGLCHWGLFNQFFSYIGGIYKLKVKDPQLCAKCKTVDCANACPVGLTDMRGSFIKKGEFRSFKCIGAGECIEACQYDNIFIYDIRHKIKSLGALKL